MSKEEKVIPLFPISRVRKVEITSSEKVLENSKRLLEEIDELLEKQNQEEQSIKDIDQYEEFLQELKKMNEFFLKNPQ